MSLVSIYEAPNSRLDGRSLLLHHTEKEMVMTDGKHLKGDKNSRMSFMTLLGFMPKP